jgi:hypothetical protein
VGWRDDTATYPRVMQHICGNNASCAKLGNWITENTYNQTEVLKFVQLGWAQNNPLMLDDFLTEDFTATWMGSTYTLTFRAWWCYQPIICWHWIC